MRHHRIVLSTLIASIAAVAVPAQECIFLPYPGPIEHTQPDGARIEMFRRGDAFRNWLVDARGNALVETESGVRYARIGADGAFEATDELASAKGPQSPGVARNVVPTRAAGVRRPQLPPSAKAGLTSLPSARGGGSAFLGATGTVRNLVLLLRFSNHGPSGQNRTLPTVANFTTIMNAPGGHATLAPTGSVRDHYLENSYGQFTIDSTVVGWLDMPNTETYYANGDSGLTQVTWQLIASGLAAADPLVDFDQFDQDGDGWIDSITVLHSGYGAEFGGTDQYGTPAVNRMWSHKWAIPTWTSAEGVRVSDYNISPGLWSTSGSAPGRIGVVCHELGHFFGLPDLYDTDGSSEGDGNWCLMAAGSWGFNGTQRYPSHMSPWGKIKLGWVNPTTLVSGSQSLPSVETSATIHKIDSGYAPGEYLLIENRQNLGFDAVIPQSGLAIWHIDESKGRLGANNPNNTEGYPGQSGWPGNGNHYRNALIQADGLFDLEHGNDRGDGGDVFRSGGVAQLLSTGNLNTDAYQPGLAWDNGNQITGIGASAATMTYTFGNATTPPTITTASLPAGALGVAYSTTLASSGGTAPRTWSEHRAAPGYALSDLGTQTFPLGGTARNWRADDNVWALDLPFAFPYWETQYTRVHVSSNGAIDLSPAQSEFVNRPDWLRFALRIAPLWDDLRTDTAGKDIFTDTTVPGQVRIRWAATHADTGVAVNFAVVLHSDGRIRFEYGSGNTNLTPTVGISRGEGGLNVIPGSHDGHASLTNAHVLLFTLEGTQIPPGLSLSSAGVLSGTPTQAGTWSLRPRVTDAIWRYDQRALTLTISGGDSDGDGVPDATDNCPSVPNASQANADGDSAGDACDTCTDTDGDGFGNPGFPLNTCTLDGCPNDPLKSAPGACGCGVPDTDSDGDGTANCNDGCPNDPLKTSPGSCGCGTPDTDGDGDGTPDCNDGCPNDPLKIAAGPCGCGVPDTDSDGDGAADCNDGCPNDPLKTTPGVCGCGVPETDSDGDGTPNCTDGCPGDPLKIAPGTCGCGIPDTDSDGDGTANCNDGCPNDPNKTAPGLCGCGTPDTDSDGDGTPNCNDGCPNDPLKLVPGICGCGVPDTDSDGDGTANCNDGCPDDPLKTAPGACGCGIPDTDSDGDGTPDCNDGCPNDPLKVAAGQCGCGVPDTDSDGDGTANCNDGCPSDPLKTAPGPCGCGTPDTDSDGDGTPNCTDGCPNDPLKVLPGICGCGVPDTDSDGDGTPNCNDGCPNDPLKIAPGLCGCSTPDTDSDGDGTPNCQDGCPNDPLKLVPGACGCGIPDTDSDGDGTANCIDGCPNDPLKIAPGICGCGVPETDTDGDGVLDCWEGCPNDPNKTSPGICGCGVPDTDTDGDGLADCIDNCAAIPNPAQADCDANGVGDACELASGAPDCNQNAIPDACDIANGTSLDADQNGVPDECTGALTPFCFGDGSGTACPCGNASLPASQSGCLNSLGTGGRLVGSGSPSVTADTLVLSGSAMPNSSALYFQGTGQASGGAGAVFGDGLRCPAGGVIRLGTKTNAAGVSQYPAAGDAPISVRGAIPPLGGTRHYQVWYRNAANYCTSSTFNLTNGLTAVWVP